MQTSEQTTDLMKAVAKVQAEVTKLPESGKNPHFGSKFVPLEVIVAVVKPILTANGLVMIQEGKDGCGGPGMTTTIIHAETGQWLSTDFPMNPAKKDPQGDGSLITYGRRYAICSLFGIVGDKDDDGNEASGRNRKPPNDPQGRPQPSSQPPAARFVPDERPSALELDI